VSASTLVAVIAARGAIRETTYSSVACSRPRPVRMRRIARMTSIDTGEHRIIRGIDMAIGAVRRRLRHSDPRWGWVRKLECRMGENGSQPRGRHPRSVAGNAGRWIRGRHVIRRTGTVVLRRRVVRLMAAITIRGWIAYGIVAAQMAVCARIHHRPDRPRNRGARRQHVRTLQWEARRGVVKLSIGPKKSVMAGRAE